MATRPVFVAEGAGQLLVRAEPVEFTWYPGLSRSQKQKSIQSLHSAASALLGGAAVLEISSKSDIPLGVSLSAFNLMLRGASGRRASVEVLFQGSKVFERGGPYIDLYAVPPVEAKRDERLKQSGALTAFRFGDTVWPLSPPTAFYDWLYISALRQNVELADQILEYRAFSDIEFNPERSINCQAAAAALYKALSMRGLLEKALSSSAEFLKVHALQGTEAVPTQTGLF